MKMMTLEEAKEYTRQRLALYYSGEQIENVVKNYVTVDRPGIALVKSVTKPGRFIEMYL